MNARPISTVSSSPDDVEALTPNHFLLGRAHASMPPLQTQQQSTMEIRPTTRNPYLETLDEGVYRNTTAMTTIGRITGNNPTDDDQTRVYSVKIRDKLVSIPAI